MRSRLSSSHFVGRVGELAELELCLSEAEAGRPTLVLLGGDSGIGKTRLVTEFADRLDHESVLVLRGESIQQGDAELPYAPLLGALRPLVRERHPALQALSTSSRAQLATLLPALGDGDHEPPGQLRLFEALLELLDILGEDRPVALVLEDMHWADPSTRTFVAFLARSLRRERVLLLLTYRSDEMHRRHPLRPLLSELERLERARRIDLRPLDRSELAAVLGDILGQAPEEQLLARLFERSEGNPLYTEELLAAGLDGRGAAPQSLRDAFLLRIERLSSDAQRAVRTIAVGQRLDEEAIAAVSGLEGERLTASLREAVSEHVIVALPDGRLCFRHALLRESAYDDLLPGERVDLHLALAIALQERSALGDDGEVELATAIAHHYEAAGDQPGALAAAVAAARAAQRIHAHGEAAALAERALELWPRVPDADRTIDRVTLLTIAADAHEDGGDRGRGEVLLERALDELGPDGEPRLRAALLTRMARAQWALNRGPEGVATAQQALALLPEDDGGVERVALLAWLARTRVLRGRFREAIREGEEALAAALALGDAHIEGQVLNTLGMAQIALGQVDEGVQRLRRALSIARESDDVDAMAHAYSNLADMLNVAGRSIAALGTAQEGLQAVPPRRNRNHAWLSLTVSELAFEVGDWDTARRHLASSSSNLTGRLLIFSHLRRAETALGEGDEATAAECLEAVGPLVAVSSEPQWHGTLGALLAELRRRQRDLPRARAAVGDALDRLELCTDDVMRIARVSAVGVTVEADIAQRARDLGEAAEARGALARARIHVQRLRAAAAEGGPVEAAWRSIGAAEMARGRGRPGAALWASAATEWDAVSRPYPAAIARWRETEAHIEAGDRRAALPPARLALASARHLGSHWLEQEITQLCSRARLELGGAEDDSAAAAEAQPVPFDLTPRELQVLALVAEGATNRQIGTALYMAEKTASVHVSRILAKLGVRSRTQAAAVAHRLQLS